MVRASWWLVLLSLLVAPRALAAAPRTSCIPDVPRLDATTPTTPGKVVLTFDDGPHPRLTAGVLDALARHRLPATFFVLGRNIDPDTFPLVQRMEAEGHLIASHSYNHDIGMATHGPSVAGVVAYIRGQHEATRILIEVALLARSRDDFVAMQTRIFGHPRRLSSGDLRERWPLYRSRHQALLRERGFPGGRYEVRYTRPPGGGPYVQRQPAHQPRYDRALREAGLINVLWHAESGDVDPDRRQDIPFLRDNIRRAVRRGGLLLVHDYIARAALLPALAELTPSRVMILDDYARRSFGCAEGSVPKVESPLDLARPSLAWRFTLGRREKLSG